MGGPDKGFLLLYLVEAAGGSRRIQEKSSLLRIELPMEQHISAWSVSNPTGPRESAPADLLSINAYIRICHYIFVYHLIHSLSEPHKAFSQRPFVRI